MVGLLSELVGEVPLAERLLSQCNSPQALSAVTL